MFYSDDPIADFNRYDREQAEALERLPKCICCGEPIQEDNCYDFGDGPICEECVMGYINEHFKRSTEYFM